MKKTLSAATVTGLAMFAMAAPAAAVHEGSRYQSNLSEVATNDPGSPSGSGTLEVSQDGETMTVTINASGLADFPHAMHIHAIVDGENVTASSCPTAALDANDDGVVDVAEGAPAYGGVQVSLTTTGDTSPDSALAVDRYPAGTTISYSRAGIPIPDVLKPNLGKVHFVVHGVDENQDGQLTMDQQERSSLTNDLPREATLPALCGTLTAVGGVVQAGDGATSTTSSNAALLAGGMAVMAGAGLGLRRRFQA